MHALVDGDIVVWRCAAVAEGRPVEEAQGFINNMMNRILEEVGATSWAVYIGGGGNFRKEIYTEYKANRKDMKLPQHLEACREHLITEWGARIVNGMETDDMLGIEQTRLRREAGLID